MTIDLDTRLTPADTASAEPAGLSLRPANDPGIRCAGANGTTLAIDPGLASLDPDPPEERWFAGPASSAPSGEGGLYRMVCGDVLFLAREGPDDDLRERTRDVYRDLVAACREAGYPYLLRMWNFFGRIHEPEQGLERYQAFCTGRAEALEALEIPLGGMPAATAIGSDHAGLFVHAIAAREPGTPVENPRQVSAYHYPERYSPKSPSFARATRIETPRGPMLLISGTASITGHESRHPGDIAAQTRETLANLDTLHAEGGTDLPGLRWLRVYLRHPEHRDTVEAILGEHYGERTPPVQWVRGDVCRQELLIEIEGVHA
ncbi:hypothetical protein [Thioalkalivibrio sp. ALE23]|uniref:chorismate transformation enzyme, FkbO/Hyg5 family n=1 Tax=Thioalkalivibrio sp. ALE23 TaxID=1265495 RepID=UPI00036366B2|nr:hypothetical protein [Thioalkalivibrio sp. ALE23]